MPSTPRKQSLVPAVLVLGLLAIAALGGCRESLLKSIEQDVEKAEYIGAPLLVVTQGTTVIEQGESYGIFGNVPIDAVDAYRQFRILNDGDANLILSGAIAVTLEGDDEFVITDNAQKTYAPGESDEFLLTFDPDEQLPFSTTLTIQSNDASQSVFSFTVTGSGTFPDAARPEINSKAPDNGATLVPVSSNVSVTFSEPMKANVASDSIFRLYPPASATMVAASYSRDDDGDVVTLDPVADLQPGAQYTVEVREDAMDLANNLLVGGTIQWSFTTLPLPGAPVLASPADAAVDQALSPTLDWSDCSNAESYELYWNTSGSFGSTPNATVVGGPPASQYALSGLARGTKYYWKVVAVNSSGEAPCAATFSFTTIPNPPAIPALSSPANAATGLGTSVTLSWAAASGAASYNVYCDTNANPATLKTNTNSLSYAMTTSYATRYYWKVEAVNSGGAKASTIRSFDTLYPPGAPALSAPANAAIGLGTTVTVSWAAGSGGTPASYKVYCDTNANPTTLKGTTASTSMVIAVSYATHYYWKVEATNAAGAATSTARSFDTLYPPGAPALSAPANAATGLTSPVALSWAAGSGGAVDKYDLFCDTNADPTTLQTTTASTSYALTASYSTRYYWKVKAMNAAGSTISTIRSFDTLTPPGAPALSAPANGVTGLLSPVALSWAAGSGGAPSSYRVYCDGYNPPKALVSTTSSTSYSMAASYNARYYWQVIGTNAAGSATSSVRSFDTLYKPASAPALGVPADGASDQSLFVRFTWSAVSGATSYDVYLGTASAPAFYKNVTTLYCVPTTPLAYKTGYFWRVVAKNAAGTGPVQSARKLATRPDMVWPLDKSTGVPRSPIECDWPAVPNAVRYVLEGSANGTTFADLYDGAAHFFYDVDPPTPLPANTKYYWRVTSYNSKGLVIGTSPTYSFMTVP